jgi:hypothetical protein
LCVAKGFLQARGKAIAKVRRTQLAAYLKICALLVPREMKLEPSGGVKAMTDEQLDAALEALRALLAERAGEAANVLEGTAEAVALTARAARPRQYRQRNAAGGRVLRGGHVHPAVRQRDAAAERPRARHPQSQRIVLPPDGLIPLSPCHPQGRTAASSLNIGNGSGFRPHRLLPLARRVGLLAEDGLCITAIFVPAPQKR